MTEIRLQVDGREAPSRGPRFLFGALILCLVAALLGAVFVGPAYRQLYADFEAPIGVATSVALSAWWWPSWVLGLAAALIGSAVTQSARTRRLLLASALGASFIGATFFVVTVAAVRVPMMAIKDHW